MAREGGSYIKEKGGKAKLVHRTQPAVQKTKKAENDTAPAKEVSTNEDA